jgi:uncharacterized protein
MAGLDDLLAVQELDTAADVLRHKRDHLPERAALTALENELAALEREAAPMATTRHDIDRAQKVLEDELAILAEKAAGVDRQLYGGNVTNLRELQGLQDEVAALDRRRRQLEDQVLERMVEGEPIDAALEAFATRRAALDADAVSVTAALIEAETAIDGELAVVEAQRAQAAVDIPANLLERYEKLRRGHDGVGVARLDGTRCLGCHLALPAADVEAVRRAPADEPVECPECGRLLVR